LWRGELELPRAFWDGAIIYGSLLNLVTSFAAFALLTTDLPAILAVAVFLSPAPYNLLTTIGVWRSASRYRGPAHWPTLARIAVIVWAIVATTI
jgi:hypothetical protein